MKYFIKSILLFISVILAINFIVYFALSRPAIFENYIFNEHPVSEYNKVIISDSHGMYLGNIPNDYDIANLSYKSDTYADLYLKLVYFSKKLTAGDTILLGVDNHQLSTYRDGPGNIDRNIVYANDFSEINPSYIRNRHHKAKFFTYLPLANGNMNGLIEKYIQHNFFNVRTNKRNKLSDLDSISINNKGMQRFDAQFKDRKYSKEQATNLTKIIRLCNEKELVLLGIKFPLSPFYRSLVKKVDYGAADLLRENDLRVLDFQDAITENKYFYDQDHLNVWGSEKFCKILNERLRENSHN